MQNDLREALARLTSIKRSGSYVDSILDAYGHAPRGKFFDDLDAILALLSACPLALGGQKGEGVFVPFEPTDDMIACAEQASQMLEWQIRAAWSVMVANAPSSALSTTPARPEALEGALSILERLLDHSGARGSFDAMKHGDAVKDAEELLRSARSPGHTDLMVTPESIDAYMRVNPMEAQDEGAAGELKPCPFCGGEAEIIHLDDGDNAGGSCVCCTKCQASGNVEFGRKENFVDNWNRRAHPSPPPAADADRVRPSLWWNAEDWEVTRCDLEDAYEDAAQGEMRGVAKIGNAHEFDPIYAVRIDIDTTGDGEADDYEIKTFPTKEEADAYLADALKSTAAKEGGE